MPQSSSDLVKQSLTLGKIGLNTSLQVVALSPVVVGAALLSGTITLPVAAAIMSSMVTLPIYSTAGCVAAPVLFNAGQQLLTSNLLSLPDRVQPLAQKISEIQLQDIDETVTLKDLLPTAPLSTISSKLNSGFTRSFRTGDELVKPQQFQMGQPFDVPHGQDYNPELSGIIISANDWIVLDESGDAQSLARPDL